MLLYSSCRPPGGRKSFGTAFARGGGGGGSSADAPALSGLHLGAMFTTVLKMSSENKINAKNTWSLPLIDHMERIIYAAGGDEEGDSMGAGATRGGPAAAAAAATSAHGRKAGGNGRSAAIDAAMMNFQKASCTLDASIKIYASRVDDVWSSSYRVLENLSRTDRKDGKPEADGAGDKEKDAGTNALGGRAAATAAGGGSTSRATGDGGSGSEEADAALALGAAGSGATIETNMAAITSRTVESEFDIDPLFHKMSRNFDEGGAAGMLLHRLAVHDRCTIAFDSEDCADTDGASGSGYTPAACLAAAGFGQPSAAFLEADASVEAIGMVAVQLAGSAHAPADAFASALAAAQLVPSLDTLYESLAQYATALGSPSAVTPQHASAGAAASPRAASSAVSLLQPAVPSFDVAAAAAQLELNGAGDSDVTTGATQAPASSNTGTGSWALLRQLAAVTAASQAQASTGGASDAAADLAAVDEMLAQAGDGPEMDAHFGSFGGGDDSDDDGGGGIAQLSVPTLPAAAHSEYAFLDVAALTAAGSAAASMGGVLGGIGVGAANNAKHWKLRAALNRAAAASTAHEAATNATAGPNATDGAVPMVPASASEASVAGTDRKKKSKKAAGAGGSGVDFTAAGRLPSDTFARAKRTVAGGAGKQRGGSRARGSAASAAAARDSEQLTPAAMDKMARGSPETANAVPLALWPAQLDTLAPPSAALTEAMRMFLRPNLVLLPASFVSGSTGSPTASSAAAALFGSTSASAAANGGVRAAAVHGSYDSDDGGDYDGYGYDGDGGDMDASGVFIAAAPPPAAPAVSGEPGFEAGTAGEPVGDAGEPLHDQPHGSVEGVQGGADAVGPVSLVPAGRRVERIRVRYETVAKRVDVRALKDDMWGYLEQRAGEAALPMTRHRDVETAYRAHARAAEGQFIDVSGAEAAAAATAAASTSSGDTAHAQAHPSPTPGRAGTTFTDAITAMAPSLSSAVSVPFYFITILHLANEHGLQLNGRDGLEDFDIAALAEAAHTRGKH